MEEKQNTRMGINHVTVVPTNIDKEDISDEN
jgi:hypothetical protein